MSTTTGFLNAQCILVKKEPPKEEVVEIIEKPKKKKGGKDKGKKGKKVKPTPEAAAGKFKNRKLISHIHILPEQ